LVGTNPNETNVPSQSDIECHVPALRRYARALVSRDAEDPRAAADQLVQDTWERALRAEHQARSGNLKIWLYATLTSLNRIRVRDRMIAPAGEHAHGHQPRSQGVTEAVAGIPLECREALLLVVLEGLTYAEAGDVLGVPKLGLGHRIARARHILDEHLDAALTVEARAKARPSPHLRLVK
jgi:RNA polymerase sigma-70 factor (ECF subfamily)